MTENDTLQLVGVGNFGLEEINELMRCRLSKINQTEELFFIYKQHNNFQAKDDEYYSDESDDDEPHISDEDIEIFQKEILVNRKQTYENVLWCVFNTICFTY
ncbi:hypothetical protein TRFO_17368 [Tritrichomonas foetus]|uniref:Uncharacterized protein n=1 Tax=Tritrichomonas foetus TaxID=1144522 RepID=A0A1J4KN43_9EUKA|nr:hypothetical protein TRFO_17368 [Tritrichomonas foetus]|eukprot:OHT12737.1 hypothetical protein TRFO_17368 [Tritrichomonas foetus]